MARRNNVDASVTITLNGEQAKKVTDELRQKAEKLRAKLTEMQKAANPDTKEISRIQKELNAVDKALKSAITDTKKYEETLKRIDSASIKELTSAQRALLAQIKKLAPGSDEFVAATQKYKQVTARIKSVETAYKNIDESQQSMFRRLASGMNRYFLMASTAIATVTGLSMKFRDAANQAAELDDKMAQVMKTTGLTHQQVEELNEAFKKMDTRTTIEQLNDLAYQAGKLGFNTVESVQQFVEAADIINVALGDVLGENATLEIAKLAQVYSQSTDIIEGKDLKGKMMAVGSAINQLGKESTASESYMVDFLGRLGGVATQAGLSADQILGYASALDQMKQKVEMSATAFQKLIQQMVKKPEEFVKAARMPLQDFINLMNEDMNAAIFRVLEGFNDMGGFTELVPIFKDMGLDGARAASVVASLAANLDRVSVAQSSANEHIEKDTSMLNEFGIMNESAKAKLEKRRKELHNYVVEFGQSLNPVLLKSTNAIIYLIKAVVKFGKEMLISSVAIAALVVAIKLHNLQVGIATALQATWTATTNMLKAAFYLLTGQITKATAAMAAMNAVSKMTVWGLVAAGITTAVMAISKWIKSSKEAADSTANLTKAQKELNDVDKTVSDRLKDESERVRYLTDYVNTNTISIDKRRSAIEELQSIIPDYHASLTDEGILINNNTKAIEDYLNRLEDQIRLEELIRKRAEFTTQIKELQKAKEEAFEQQRQWQLESFGEADPSRISVFGPWDEEIPQIEEALRELDDMISGITSKWSDSDPGQRQIQPFFSTYDEALADLESAQAEIENSIKRDYINRQIDQDTYEEAMRDSNLEFLKKKLDLANEYGQDTTEAMSAWLDAQVEANKIADKQLEDLAKKAQEESKKAEEERIREQQKKLNELTRMADRFKRELLEPIDAYREELQKLNEARDQGLIDEEQYQQILINLRKKYSKRASDKISQEEGLSIFQRYELEREALRQFWEDGRVGWEEYEKAVARLRLNYAQNVLTQISSVLGQVGNFVSSMRDMEMAHAEEQYQADLTAAGDNAEERERVEADYQRKQLDIKKKYADADMAVNIAKATAEGALAITRAFADMPYPAAIAVSALIAATTAAQIATIVAQRNAIKNTTVSGTGASSGSDGGYGERVINGKKSGGYAEKADSDDVPMGVYHANEWIAPAWLVRREPVMFRNLEEYRQTGRQPSSMGIHEMKQGGYASQPATVQSVSVDKNTAAELSRLSSAIDKLVNEGIQSYIVYNQFQEFQKQRARFKNITSKK